MLFQKKEKVQEWMLQQLGSSEDVAFKKMQSKENVIHLLYIKSLCDDKKLYENIIEPFYKSGEKEFENYLDSLPDKKEYKNREETLREIMFGSVVIFTKNFIYILELPKVVNNTVAEATVETVIQGPLNALTESLTTNLNLIRTRYPQPSLRVVNTKIGKLSKTTVAVVYDNNIAKKELVKKVEEDLSKLNVDILQSAGQLQKLITKRKRSLFPTLMVTERPDRIVFNLAQGKVLLLIDGTPFTLLAPAVFYDFMSSMEETYQSYWVGKFIVILRYIGLFISTLLPGFYVGVTAYNPELFRVQLALSIAGSRIGVPYPAYLEVFLMLLMMELLTEASIRLPNSIGSTATTVGGLILGQAAVEAGLVSNVMIIIVAAVAISNFVIPINAMTFAMRVTKYIFLLLSIFFGMVGLTIGWIGLITYLANLSSYGQPFLRIFLLPEGFKKEVDPH